MHLGPDFRKSYDELTKNSWKSLTYEKLRMNTWLSKTLQKSYEKLRTKLCTTYETSENRLKIGVLQGGLSVSAKFSLSFFARIVRPVNALQLCRWQFSHKQSAILDGKKPFCVVEPPFEGGGGFGQSNVMPDLLCFLRCFHNSRVWQTDRLTDGRTFCSWLRHRCSAVKMTRLKWENRHYII